MIYHVEDTKNHLQNGVNICYPYILIMDLCSIMCSFVDEEDKDSLQELATEQKCFIEHIFCTKPLPCRQPAPIRGFWIVPDILGPTMICITSTYECLIRPLL